jgi:hypothetical protein
MNPNIFHLVFSLFFFTIWSSNFFFTRLYHSMVKLKVNCF